MSLAAELDIPETGAIFTFGKSHFADNEPSHFFIKNDPVISISCGDDHTAVVCRNGRVFAFGSNGHGQLGLGHTETVERPACLKWLKPRKAKQVACGRSHTIVLTDSNQLFATGDNSEGQLGIGSQDSQVVPQFLEISGEEGVNVKQVAAGAEHTLVLFENGKAYACGSNSEGQLGVGENIKNSNKFIRIALENQIKSISCGYYHTVVITDNAEAYIFGDNENQRLGIPNSSTRIYSPTLLTIGERVSAVHCGQYHTFLMTEGGTVYGVGSNEHGQLGLPRSVIEVNHPTEISFDKPFENQKILRIACGSAHTAFVTSNGYIFTCGDASHQKLCHESIADDFSNNNTDGVSTANQYMPKKVEILEGFNVSDVACGGCHTIIAATKIIQNSNNNITVGNMEISRLTPIHPELPPLQKIPASIMNKSVSPSDYEMMDGKNEPLSKPNIMALVEVKGNSVERPESHKMDTLNGNTEKRTEEDKHSLDSLEPYVSGSHILEINNLNPILKENGENKTMEKIEIGLVMDETNMNSNAVDKVLVKQITIEEVIEKTVARESKPVIQMKSEVEKNIEATKSLIESENITEMVVVEFDKTTDATENGMEKGSPSKDMLQVPETIQHSPIMSTRSEASQKSAKSSNNSLESDHETIACNSEKSSPATTKVSKTQAVIPILRTDEMVATFETKLGDEADVIQSKITKNLEGEGRFSKFLNTLKNESCMGKSRVLSDVDMKAQAARDEISPQTVSDHTNSRACIIL